LIKSGIYGIYSKSKPERFYIGSAIDFKIRKYHHFYDLRRNNHKNIKLQRHYNKYGKDDLTFEVIEYCHIHDLLAIEQFYIDEYSPFFNICKIADYGNQLGLKRSEETRQKLSKANTGKFIGEKNPMFNKHHSKETKGKISEALKGKPGLVGEKNGMYGKESPMKGKKKKPESIQKSIETRKNNNKISSLKGINRPKDVCEKISKSLTGKKLKPESIRKREETRKRNRLFKNIGNINNINNAYLNSI
jgi:group I intron endonuclease